MLKNRSPKSGLQFAGVLPTRQPRSEATAMALIEAGRIALKTKAISELTVEDICAAANTSVGAFYGRFASKEALFGAITEITARQIADEIKSAVPAADHLDDEEFVAAVSKVWLKVFREHQAVYVAVSRHVAVRREAWAPFRRLGHEAADILVAHLSSRLKRRGQRNVESDIRVCVQIMNGFLMNAVLNEPGPLQLGSDAAGEAVRRLLSTFLRIESTSQPREASQGRRRQSDRRS